MEKKYNLQGVTPNILMNKQDVCEVSDLVEELLEELQDVRGIINMVHLSEGNWVFENFTKFKSKAEGLYMGYCSYIRHFIGYYNADLYTFFLFPPYWTISKLIFTTEKYFELIIKHFDKNGHGVYSYKVGIQKDKILRLIGIISTYQAMPTSTSF